MTSSNTRALQEQPASTSNSFVPQLLPGHRHDHPAAFKLFLRIFVLLALLSSLWSIATPLMAYPDEPAHTIKAAAVARGQFMVMEGQSYGHGVHVQVPSYIANLSAQTCTAFKRDTPASCAPPIPMNDNYLTIGVTSAGLYNPMYYWLVGLPSVVLAGAPAVFGMRVVSALLSAVFLAAGMTALTRLRRPKWPVTAGVVAMTPMVFFLCSGINPNSLEVAATMAAFCGLLVCLESARRLNQVKPAIITVGAAVTVLANTRNVSLVWLLVALLISIAFFGLRSVGQLFRNRMALATIGVMAVGVGLGILWIAVMIFAPGSTAAAPEGINNAVEGIRPHQAFLTMLDRAFDFVPQYIGVMGWLETPAPQAVMQFWGMLIVVAALAPFTARPRKNALGFWLAVTALAIVPAIIQAGLISSVGYIWQGRYNLPLFMIAVISAGLAVRFRPFPIDRGFRSFFRILIITGAVAHIYTFVYVLRRYVVGLKDNGNWQVMITNPSWQPPMGWITLTLVFSLLVLVGSAALYRYLFPGQDLIGPVHPVRQFSLGRRKPENNDDGRAGSESRST